MAAVDRQPTHLLHLLRNCRLLLLVPRRLLPADTVFCDLRPGSRVLWLHSLAQPLRFGFRFILLLSSLSESLFLSSLLVLDFSRLSSSFSLCLSLPRLDPNVRTSAMNPNVQTSASGMEKERKVILGRKERI
ncbi:S-adenosyl-L-methionine-dependentmethyltransferases superfamily protein [Striga asiatica]|uniref:S-adenosyl-L-methionine-dependentmethyltransferases superfamily protein n=1 Tax=Striga asiatica TaxID=4170 RepID=A0A5A7P7G9_STRAF|nr:S-adenosyl-L-methionine-dependentmethyltransferases superfamily protein [Striga asiatica]